MVCWVSFTTGIHGDSVGGIVLNTTLLYFLVRGVQKFFDIFV